MRHDYNCKRWREQVKRPEISSSILKFMALFISNDDRRIEFIFRCWHISLGLIVCRMWDMNAAVIYLPWTPYRVHGQGWINDILAPGTRLDCFEKERETSIWATTYVTILCFSSLVLEFEIGNFAILLFFFGQRNFLIPSFVLINYVQISTLKYIIVVSLFFWLNLASVIQEVKHLQEYNFYLSGFLTSFTK